MAEGPVSARDGERFRKIRQGIRTAQSNLVLSELKTPGSDFGTTEQAILGKADISIIFYRKTSKKQ
jgi:hypothetical protein